MISTGIKLFLQKSRLLKRKLRLLRIQVARILLPPLELKTYKNNQSLFQITQIVSRNATKLRQGLKF